MNSKLLWAVLFCLSPFLISAQPLVKLSKPYRKVESGINYYFESDHKVHTVKISPEGVEISIFDIETLEQIKTGNSKLPKNFSYENIVKIDKKVYLFYSSWDKSSIKEQLKFQMIDFNSCKLDGNEKIIMTTNKCLDFNVFGYKNYAYGISGNKFYFYQSFDKSKLLIVNLLSRESKRDAVNKDVMGINVFDNELNKISLQEIQMPHTEKLMDNIHYAVDSDGNAFILSLVYKDEPVNKDKKIDYFVELLKVAPNSTNVATIPVILQGKFINKLWLHEISKNKMVCAGYYNNKKGSSSADGIMLFKIENDNKISGMINHEIPLEVLNQFVNKKAQNINEKNEKEDKAQFSNLILSNLIIQEDGSIILTGEQFFQAFSHYYAQGSNNTIVTSVYEDILTSKINADGSLAWMRKLPKLQMGSEFTLNLSYKYMRGDKEHYYIFMDNEKNKLLPLNEMTEKYMDGTPGLLTAYKVNDETGKVEKISILNSKDVQGVELLQFLVDRIVSISPTEFVFEANKKGKEDIMLKVQFKQ